MVFICVLVKVQGGHKHTHTFNKQKMSWLYKRFEYKKKAKKKAMKNSCKKKKYNYKIFSFFYNNKIHSYLNHFNTITKIFILTPTTTTTTTTTTTCTHNTLFIVMHLPLVKV